MDHNQKNLSDGMSDITSEFKAKLRVCSTATAEVDHNQKNLSDSTSEIEKKLQVSSTAAEGDHNQKNLSDSTSEIEKKLQVSSTAETDKDLEIERLRSLLADKDKYIAELIDYAQKVKRKARNFHKKIGESLGFSIPAK